MPAGLNEELVESLDLRNVLNMEVDLTPGAAPPTPEVDEALSPPLAAAPGTSSHVGQFLPILPPIDITMPRAGEAKEAAATHGDGATDISGCPAEDEAKRAGQVSHQLGSHRLAGGDQSSEPSGIVATSVTQLANWVRTPVLPVCPGSGRLPTNDASRDDSIAESGILGPGYSAPFMDANAQFLHKFGEEASSSFPLDHAVVPATVPLPSDGSVVPHIPASDVAVVEPPKKMKGISRTKGLKRGMMLARRKGHSGPEPHRARIHGQGPGLGRTWQPRRHAQEVARRAVR